MRIIRQLFCHHEWEFERNIYDGDEIERVGGDRSWWRCKKCGKRRHEWYLYLPYEEVNRIFGLEEL